MITHFYDENRNKSSLDTDKWQEEILPLLEHGDLYYQFDGESIVDIAGLSKKMVIPNLFYTLLEMSELLGAALEDELITADLIHANENPADLDNYEMLSLSYEQSEFITKYEKEVKAWLPVAIKKYIRANNKNIKDVLSGRI